jgi:hypothetical protein
MERIELMIIGAQKAGTTSLGKYLAEHPLLVEPLCMEFAWFTDRAEEKKDLGAYMHKYFPGPYPEGTRRITKMANLYCSRPGLLLLRQYFPECRLAMVVRDPVQRAYSAYRMACYDGWLKYDPRFFQDLLMSPAQETGMHRIFLGYGQYARHLQVVYDLFPREQVHLFRFEDLQRHPQQVCNALFDALGLEQVTLQAQARVHNETRMARSKRLTAMVRWLRSEKNPLKRLVRAAMPYHLYLRLGDGVRDMNRSDTPFPPLPDEVKRLLADHYRADDAALAGLTGLDLSNWTSQRLAR